MADPLLDLVNGQQQQKPAAGVDPLLSLVAPAGAPTPETQQPSAPNADLRAQEKQESADAASRIGALVYGGTKQAADLVQAPAQIVLNGAASILKNPTISGKPGPVSQWVIDKADQFNNYLSNQERQFQADTQGDKAAPAGIGRVGVGVLPFLAGGGAPAAASKVGNALNIGSQGAAYGALTQPANNVQKNADGSNDFFTQKGIQAATGATSSLVGQWIGNKLAKIVSPDVRPEVQTLVKAGVTPTPGQILGGGWQRFEDASTSIPVIGDMIKNAQRRAMDDFNTAALKRSGVDVKAGGQEGLKTVRKAISGEYSSILGQMTHHPDQQFEQDFLQAGINNRLSPEGIKELAGMLRTDYVPKFGSVNGRAAMTGDDIKAFDQQLRQNANNFARSQDPMQQRIGDAYNDIRDSFKESLARQNGQSLADALKAADKKYASYAQYKDAALSKGALDNGGVVTPAQYMGAIARGAKASGRKTALSEGEAMNQDLAAAGNDVLGNKVPDSGTPFRSMVGLGYKGAIGATMAALGHDMIPPGVASAAALAAPFVGSAAGAAMLPYTKTGQKLAAALLVKRPNIAPAVADAVRKGAPIAGAALTPAEVQFLSNYLNGGP